MTSNNFLQNCLKLISLNKHQCEDYRNYLNSQKINLKQIKKIEDLPFLHIINLKKENYSLYLKMKFLKLFNPLAQVVQSPQKFILIKKALLNNRKF